MKYTKNKGRKVNWKIHMFFSSLVEIYTQKKFWKKNYIKRKFFFFFFGKGKIKYFLPLFFSWINFWKIRDNCNFLLVFWLFLQRRRSTLSFFFSCLNYFIDFFFGEKRISMILVLAWCPFSLKMHSFDR